MKFGSPGYGRQVWRMIKTQITRAWKRQGGLFHARRARANGLPSMAGRSRGGGKAARRKNRSVSGAVKALGSVHIGK